MDTVEILLKKLQMDTFISRETLSYLFWGFATTLVGLLLFQIFMVLMPYKVANIGSIIIAVMFAYIVNKRYVFCSQCLSNADLLLEIFRFIIARSFTMILDFFGLIFLVDFLYINPFLGKVFITILVVIINYFLSRFGVFKVKR